MTSTSLPPSRAIQTLRRPALHRPARSSRWSRRRSSRRMWFAAVRGADFRRPGSFRHRAGGHREGDLIFRGRRRKAAGVPQRLPAPRARRVRRRVGSARAQPPVHVPRLDLRPRRQARGRAEPDQDAGHRPDRVRPGQVHLREWLGYVWVCLADEPPSFEDDGDRDGRRAARARGDRPLRQVDQLEVGRRITYDVKANWKLIIENFMECYHCATIHPELTEVLPGVRRRLRRPVLRRPRRRVR